MVLAENIKYGFSNMTTTGLGESTTSQITIDWKNKL